MQNTARIVGYSAAGTLLLGILTLLWYLQFRGPGRSIKVEVHFPALGVLLEDDAVTRKGVEIGKVRNIRLRNDSALVTLEFYRSFFIPGDSRFINFNYSLMGERMVLFVPGNSSEPMDLKSPQPGLYSEGVSEMIHKVDELLAMVQDITRLAGVMDTGSDSVPALKTTLRNRIYPVAENWSAFIREFSELEESLTGNLETVAGLSVEIANTLPEAGKDLDKFVKTTSKTIATVDSLMIRALPLLEKTEALLAAAQDPDSPMHSLLSDPTLYRMLKRVNDELSNLLDLVRRDGARDLIHWRNLRLWRN